MSIRLSHLFQLALLILMALALYIVWPLLQNGLQPQGNHSEAAQDHLPPQAIALAPAVGKGRVLDKAGIEVLGVGYSAAGYMLDFRYRVLDPEKAKRYITRQIKPVLLDGSSGAKLFAAAPPKLGTMRHTGNNLKKGKTYFVMFANPGRYIQPGSKVDIQIADIVVDGLTVVSGV